MNSTDKQKSHSQTHDFMPWIWLRRRELGLSLRKNIGVVNSISKVLYSNFKALHTWEPSKTVDDTHHGGIFNFDFSTDGSLMGAACEGHSILLFDPFNGHLINSKSKAHTDCVNCIRFLDSRMFASCSDDHTVALWDARYLKNKLHHLKGHSNWVKNIEYVSDKGLLVTSGFDGNIFTWDINSYSENEIKGKKVFHTNRLTRSKLTPDNRKLVISTQTGSIILIHNLDLSTLADDLRGFKMSKVHHYNKKGHRRNRVEVINDWPTGNHAKVVASIQVHPQGWCVLSRNMSKQDVSEFTCIHDIQEYDEDTSPEEKVTNTEPLSTPQNFVSSTSTTFSSSETSVIGSGHGTHLSDVPSTSTSMGSQVMSMSAHADTGSSSQNTVPIHPASHSSTNFSIFSDESSSHDSDRYDHGSILPNGHPNGHLVDLLSFSDTSSDSDSDSSSDSLPSGIHIVYQANRQRVTEGQGQSQNEGQGQSSIDGSSSNNNSANSQNREFVRVSRTVNLNTQLNRNDILTLIIQSGERRRVVNLNYHDSVEDRPIANGHTPKLNTRDRLLCYTEEPNVGKGFIKELCFSSDGRIICSPFGFGVRLLSFDPDCRELCDCIPNSPVKLYEVGSCMSHANVVVTSKFSPKHYMLVSGCLSGRVSFHQPVL